MNKHTTFFLLCVCMLGLLASCSNKAEPRYPIEVKSGSYLKESIEKNILLNQKEEALILDIIQKDTLNTYLSSKTGFWYFYQVKDTLITDKPIFGDKVEFSYNFSDITGNELVSAKHIGVQTYSIDQNKQDLISGIRDGLKLMQAGETVTFLFPSYKAFGYYGYEDYIGPNTPLQCTITLNFIDKSKNNYEEN